VHSKVKIFILFTGFVLILSTTSVKGQFLQDTAALNLVKKDIYYIYNLQFSDARSLSAKIADLYPGHPVVHLISGMITYWENYPLLDASPARSSFEHDLNECISIVDKNNNPDNATEYLLANLCARGFLLLYYTDNDLVMDVIPLATGSYKYLMRSFDHTTECADFYYFTGVYKYYRVAYPKAYPVYKPLVMLFPSGDMIEGLRELNLAAIKSVVLRAESYLLLTTIFESFENDYSKALIYSRFLHDQYPENLQFLAVYLKNLLLLKSYDEAEKLIDKLPLEPLNKYFRAQLNIFKGILREKKYRDNISARQYYGNGIRDLGLFGDYGNEYTAYGYFGLSRISEARGEKTESHMYRKEALKHANFKDINFDK
jgi:hypothetical protein